MSAGLPPEEIAAFLQRCAEEDAARGLPPHVTDPTVLRLVVNALMGGPPPRTKPTTRKSRGVTTPPAPATPPHHQARGLSKKETVT